MTTISLVSSVLLCLCCATMCVADSASPYVCHRASGKIKVDGKMDAPAWQKADVITFFVPVTGAKPLSKTEARILSGMIIICMLHITRMIRIYGARIRRGIHQLARKTAWSVYPTSPGSASLTTTSR